MSRIVQIVCLEFALKGGFFVSGLMIYISSKESFANFTFLNSLFTLAYNGIALGLPFIFARELHKDISFSILSLFPAITVSMILFILSCVVFPQYALYSTAALFMVAVDTIYSEFRICMLRRLAFILGMAGAIVFSGNILAGALLDENWRYYGIVASGAVAVVLTVPRKFAVPAGQAVKRADLRNLLDGLGFGATHALFWVRNGLDKILLFPLIGSEEYAHYGLLFFFVAVFQTAWTSFIRMAQRKIFDYVATSYQKILRLFRYFVAGATIISAVLVLFHLEYSYIVAAGALVHFGNQVFVNVLNYRLPVYYYSISNAVVAASYLLILGALGVSVYNLSALYMASNLLLAVIYIGFVSTRTVN